MTTVTDRNSKFYNGPGMCDDYAQGTMQITDIRFSTLRKLHSVADTTVYHLLGIDKHGQKWLIAAIYATPVSTICHPLLGESRQFTCSDPIAAQTRVTEILMQFQADYEAALNN